MCFVVTIYQCDDDDDNCDDYDVDDYDDDDITEIGTNIFSWNTTIQYIYVYTELVFIGITSPLHFFFINNIIHQ